jgi:hypothetical protein
MPCNFRAYSSPQQEFFILRQTTPVGPEIGTFAGIPFHAEIQDEWGRIYRYAGTSPRKGPDYIVKLREREFILPPGIIYRMLVQPREKAVLRMRASPETSSGGKILNQNSHPPKIIGKSFGFGDQSLRKRVTIDEQ